MAIEISITKDMADKLKLDLGKTENVQPDINHWYAKVMIFNRKRYVFAVNTLTRFAVFFRLDRKTLSEDFLVALAMELDKYDLESGSMIGERVFFSLANNKRLTAQLNNCAMDLEHISYYDDWRSYPENVSNLFGNFNKSNLGKAGDSKNMVFAVDEMKKHWK